jgi:hypothetical protein
MYHVIIRVIKTGEIVKMTEHPVTHKEGCVILNKMTKYPFRQEMLQPL